MWDILKDRTVYFNLLALLVAVLGEWGYSGDLPDGWAIWVTVIVTVINQALRLFTKTPVAGKLAGRLRGE